MGTVPSYPQPIPDGALDLTPTPVDFTGDIPATLGNAGTASDGFDQLFLQVVTDLASFPNIISGIGIGLLDAAGALPELDDIWEQDFTDTLASTIVSGEPDFAQIGTDLSLANPPQSGGGGGTGGGGALPSGCDAVAGFNTQGQVPPVTRQFTFAINAAGHVTIDSITLTQDTPGLFTLQTTCKAHSQPANNTCSITIILNTTAPDGMHGKLTTVWHLPDNVEHTTVLCLGVNVPDNFPGASGGSGGGGGGGGTGGGGGGTGGCSFDVCPPFQS